MNLEHGSHINWTSSLQNDGTVFIPDRLAGLFSLHRVKSQAFACRDCGYIGHYLEGEELARMEEKLAKAKK